MGKSEKKEKKSEDIVVKKDKKEKKEKKEKKAKKEKKEKKDKKEKKEKKEKKRKHSESESEEEFIIHENLHKRSKVEAPSAPKPVQCKSEPEENVAAGWNDWNKASFNGDDAKKNKFLRLLGAKKSTPATSMSQSFTPAKKSGGLYGGLKSAIDEDEKQRITNNLEKQFEHGLQFKKQMQMGRRGGLGFN